MEILLQTLIIAGFIISIGAYVWLLIVAFRAGLVHGLLMLFIGGIYALIFSILHWEEAKKPFLTTLLGGGLIIASAILAPVLAARQTPPGESADMYPPAQSSPFKTKLAQAFAAGIAAKMKSGPVRNPHTSPTGSEVKPAWNPEALIGKILDTSTNGAGDKVTPASSNDWNEARALLRVGGVIKTGNQLFATVNQKVVKANDDVAVELNGRRYHFKVRKIDLRLNTVQFDPIEP
ncbi:MAG: hypothetical protein KKG09_10600 [Verrucomicrobia bacterium]|nr:hypothetical protein [Verrucomicrobiota bacterium]MCG2681980.1 hypothetical protein [Kiritimatiellia bacterium]MBU4248456.1 hypothetical protein [Verrucomicrobiota bacterium]MBU4292358.1 hypothetical protein [Verrucomicrobiota bacterium]MBU4428884.1 hypothetical protein [Verrucomicrobiota bacterium]